MSLYSTGIRPLVDKYLQKQTDKVRDYGDYWSASSSGYCMRKVIFDRLKVPHVPEMADDEARTTRVFESGHIFHEWLQRITKESGMSIAQEVELQDEDLMIRGHFDDLILIDDHLILYDYKTAHSKWFEYAKNRPMSYYNRYQLGTYMYMLRKAYKLIAETPETLFIPPNVLELATGEYPELTEARILKISKDDLRLHEIVLEWSEALEKEVLSYWTVLNEYWNNKKLPPCTCLDHENGFMGKRTKAGKVYNPYFWNGEPCSLSWYNKSKSEGLIDNVNI